MISLLHAFLPLAELAMIQCLLALSQYTVLRAGVFSVATAGYACLGAYSAAVLVTQYGVSPYMGIAAAALVGLIAGIVLSIPLALLRGTFQAIATTAFGEVVCAMALYAEPITQGAMGINGIPKVVGPLGLLVALVLVTILIVTISRSGIGRAFDAIRQDETVAVSLGVNVRKYHAFAFAISGTIGGLAGALLAFNTYSIVPEQFGYIMVVPVLAAVVLGGRVSVAGPIIGATILTILPELARPLAAQRFFLQGGILIFVMVYLPDGIVDTVLNRIKVSRSARHLVLQPQPRSS